MMSAVLLVMWNHINFDRGDAINGFSPSERLADPSRMLAAYWHAASTLNYMRLRGYVGVDSSSSVYTSHECLLLPMEASLTDADTRLNQV